MKVEQVGDGLVRLTTVTETETQILWHSLNWAMAALSRSRHSMAGR